MYHEPSPEIRARYVADAIARMLRSDPDRSWEDVRTINRGFGWDYEWRRSPGARILVRGERLDDPGLIRARQLAREHAPHSTSPLSA